MTSIVARKEILKRAGQCFVCLKRNHISKNCSSKMKCLKCGRQHHISICTSDTNNEVKSLHTLNVLPDNYKLSMKRLGNLLKHLNQDPEVLKEYDSVKKEQLKMA